MLSVLERSPDRRIVTPAEILADPAANADSPDLAARAALSDDVSAKLVAAYRGREPWRQTYAEQTLDIIGNRIRPSRYPIEDTPVVWLGSSALTTGLFRVEGDHCRHELRRDPRISYALASSGIPLSSQVSPNLAPFELGVSNFADYRLPAYVAGYVPPGSINAAWVAATAYLPAPGQRGTSYGDATGSWLAPATSGLLWECTAGGTSDTPTEPTWHLSLAEWAPGFAYAAGQWVSPPDSLLVFEPTTPGTSSVDTVPTWPTTAGETVTDGTTTVWTARTQMDIADGTVTWTGRTAREFPRTIRKAALMMARIIRTIDLDGQCDKEGKKMETIMRLLEGSC